MAVDQAKLDRFLERSVADAAAVWSASLRVLGKDLGLYDAMAKAGPVTAQELAEATGTDARMVAEWLANQATGGIVDYDGGSGRFTLPPEQAFVLTDPASPADPVDLVRGRHPCLRGPRGPGARLPRGGDARMGGAPPGVLCHERPRLRRRLPRDPRAGVGPRAGGCRGQATARHPGRRYRVRPGLLPNSTFRGFDPHEPSIEAAGTAAVEAGLTDRVGFGVASATDYPAEGYDLAFFFDSLHDTGDPAAALRYTRARLAADGTLVLVEPIAAERLEENLNPVARLFYAGSTILCVPSALAQPGRMALGNQVPEERWRALAADSGYSRFRRAAATPFNRVFELRP
jgi:SAM-dependent methyltransferase